MSSAATTLPDLGRQRLRALVTADIETADPLHAENCDTRMSEGDGACARS